MWPFFKDISQTRIIYQVNERFKKDKILIELNVDGICNGLVYLALEYFLSNQNKQFFKDIERLLDFKDYNKALELITHLLILYRPNNYYLDLSQSQSYKLLKSSAMPTFNFGAVLRNEQWVTFFKKLNLQENEMALIGSTDHIVCLRRKGSEYLMYDPNEESGEVPCKEGPILVNALNQAFGFDSMMALTIQVFQTQDKQINSREKKYFYTSFNSELCISLNDSIYDSFKLSIRLNDPDCLQYFIDKINIDTLNIAIAFNADLIVIALLNNYRGKLNLDYGLIRTILYNCLSVGNQKIFNDLLKYKEFYKIFTSELLVNESYCLLKIAILGENPALFQQILDLCASGRLDLNIRGIDGLSFGTHLFISALKNKTYQIMNSLKKYYQEHELYLSELDKESLVIAAIETNDPDILAQIIAFTKPKNLSHLRLDIFAVYELSPQLIEELKQQGLSLTDWQEYFLQIKEAALFPIFIFVIMSIMYIYRCLHNQVSQPMKSIYFETIPVDRGKEITDLFNQTPVRSYLDIEKRS